MYSLLLIKGFQKIEMRLSKFFLFVEKIFRKSI